MSHIAYPKIDLQNKEGLEMGISIFDSHQSQVNNQSILLSLPNFGKKIFIASRIYPIKKIYVNGYAKYNSRALV